MRVLLLVDCYLPSTRSSAKLVHDLAAEIVRSGHEAIVAAPEPELSEPHTVERRDGLTVLRVRTGRVKDVWRPRRAINEWRLSPVMWSRAASFFRVERCDLVVSYSPTIFFGALVRRLKTLWGCPSYLILRDIFPQWAVDAGLLTRGSPIHRFFRRKELEQYDAADVIGVQSPANLQYFRDEGLDERHRLEVLYNWTTTDEPDVPKTDYRRRLGLEGKTVFFYGGNIGVAQDMDNLLRLAATLADDPSIHFLFVGDGSEVPRIESHVREREVRNVTLHPAVGQRDYLGMLSEFDVGLISLDRGLRTQNYPGKMLGYLYFSIPILASINPGNDLREILERHEAGAVTLNGEDDALAATARRLAGDAELRRGMGQRGRRLLEEVFSVGRAAGQVLSHAANGRSAG